MKFPRDLDGTKLVKSLNKLGYNISRQTGSHIRITTHIKGEHHITIPNHSPLKVGTLNNIMKEIAGHLEISKEELIEKIL